MWWRFVDGTLLQFKASSEVPDSPRIAVIGAGAIGLYYGAKIARVDGGVHFLLRSDLAAVRQQGIEIRGAGEGFVLEKVNAHASTDEIGQCDVVLVCLKTTSNRDLINLIPPLLGDATCLVTLQNGLGNEEFLAQHFGAERVLGAICFVCLIRVAPGVVEHYDQGHICVGEFQRQASRRVRSLVQVFEGAAISAIATDDLATERWRKLVWNIPFNGLSIAAGGADTAEILRDAGLRNRTRMLMNEVISAANACGSQLESSEAKAQIARTEMMGPYKPSTLLDFEAGRPIELEAIWGEPLRRAEQAGAQVPEMRALYAELHATVSQDSASFRSG